MDLLLLIESGTLDVDRVGQCIEATFRRRDTHPVPGLGRTVCGDGRQVRAEPGFGGCVLARRRVQLLPAPITIRLVRSFAASIGANQLSIWRLFFTQWWTSLSGWLFGERHVQCRLRPLMLGAGAQRVNDER